MSLTIAYITAKNKPCLDWFMDSLSLPINAIIDPEVIVIMSPWNLPEPNPYWPKKVSFAHPKPTVWQGKHRLTKEDWWGASNARNTAFCLCHSEWIAFVDDRCVLLPGWIDAVRRAMKGNYAVCGAYEKRTGMTVKNGVIEHGGIITGEDCRLAYLLKTGHGPNLFDAPGNWIFGCTFALPLEWALAVNGFEELCDGLSMEDVIFGMNLANAGYPIKYDPAMKIIEDRTPGQIGPDMKRSSKERFPNDKEDKGHKALERFGKEKRTQHQWNLSDIRKSVLAGNPFPIPQGPITDWFDNQLLSEM